VIIEFGSYELDDSPARVDQNAAWHFMSAHAYWGRTRTRADFEAQLASAWRVVGVYLADSGRMVGFARAVSDGVAFAYLADVYVLHDDRGHGLGKELVRTMIDRGPGADFRWTLHTADAHGLYRQFGFGPPTERYLERPQRTRRLDGAAVEVRRATVADLPSIQLVIEAAYSKYLSRMDTAPAPLRRNYRGAIENGAVWVAGEPVAGLISFTITGGTVLVENVAVHPDRQGAGLGRRLMEFAEQYARQHGIQRLVLYTNEVMTENQAIYARLGYRVTGRRVEDGYRRIYMEKVLEDY
jgi:GNAT superfamily N-acetyltransferase